jgi:hypothetical protein
MKVNSILTFEDYYVRVIFYPLLSVSEKALPPLKVPILVLLLKVDFFYIKIISYLTDNEVSVITETHGK